MWDVTRKLNNGWGVRCNTETHFASLPCGLSSINPCLSNVEFNSTTVPAVQNSISSSNRHDILQCFMAATPGHAVAQLLEALRYEWAGRGFDFRCCHWNFFFFTYSFRPHYGTGVDSGSNRNER